MVRCRSCGCENRSEAQYCAGCGAALSATVQPSSPVAPLRCRTCGQGNPPQASFCAKCGASLTTRVETPPASIVPNSHIASHKWIIVVVVAIIAVFGIGYGLISLAGKPGNTPSVPKNVPLPVLIYQDDFSNPDSGWMRRSTEKAEFGQENGEYHFRLNDPAVFFAWNSLWGQFKDFALEMDARMESGSASTGYGMVFRLKDSNNFYRFIVFRDGSYTVGKKVSGNWTEIQGWTKVSYINGGNATNRLKIVCHESLIEASVNGHLLADITDNSFSEGFVGMFVGTREPDGHVAFDNIRVYKLD